MASLVEPRYTPEQYLALEREAEYKSEYVNGYLSAKAGASLQHNQITFNIAGEMGAQLRGRSCEAYVSDMRVKVTATNMYTYPDVVAVCGEPRLEDAHADTLLNPQVIIEVLSHSTEAYDRGEKFAHYRRLQSLTDYVLIAQDKVRIEHYVRQGEQWLLAEIGDPGGVLHLASIGCDLALREIYDRVEFPDPEQTGTTSRKGSRP